MYVPAVAVAVVAATAEKVALLKVCTQYINEIDSDGRHANTTEMCVVNL